MHWLHSDAASCEVLRAEPENDNGSADPKSWAQALVGRRAVSGGLPSNKLVNTDAQGRSVAARPPLLGRGLHARSIARGRLPTIRL